jgi:hypothetical protein
MQLQRGAALLYLSVQSFIASLSVHNLSELDDGGKYSKSRWM